MNFSIKTKLIAGFTTCILLLITIAGYMYYAFSETKGKTAELITLNSEKLELTYQMLEHVLQAGVREEQLLSSSGGAGISQVVNAQAMEDVLALTDELSELVDPQGKTILSRFRSNWIAYKEVLVDIASAPAQDEKVLALAASADAEKAQAVNNLQQLISINHAEIKKQEEINEEGFQAAVGSVVTLIVLGVLVAFLFSYWIITGINRRIKTIAVKAQKIASRAYPHEKLEQTVDDELNPIVLSLIKINESFREVTESANAIASGEYRNVEPRSEWDELGIALKDMAASLKKAVVLRERHSWLTTGLNRLNDKLMGNQSIEELGEQIISFLASYLDIQIAAMYLDSEEEEVLTRYSTFGFSSFENDKVKFAFKEGLVGQAAYEKKELVLKNVPASSLRISSGFMETAPLELLIVPIIFEEKVLGVLEFGKIEALKKEQKEFLDSALENIALAVHSAISRRKIQELLDETQVQSEELQSQQEELRQMNEELEEQTQNLRQQQEELQMTNEELEEQTQHLETKNKEVELAKSDIEQKTRQLELTSKYKSEFLANMSHELRTPLNSLLILSKDLAQNKKSNLDPEQVESAEIIYNSGNDLLLLINEVLDLSRVEAGKMSINIEKVNLRELVSDLFKVFRHQADQKGLELKTLWSDQLPDQVETDRQRLSQILKNLLSNALKFTESGSISLELEKGADDKIAIAVRDTGIGIKQDKQMTIFEAFQQADGGTARRYGGTGLGLSISRELARLLGAEIKLESQPGKGSVFTLLLPLEAPAGEAPVQIVQRNHVQKKPVFEDKSFLNYPSIEDDRETLEQQDKKVLIIEDDLQFLKILKKQSSEKGFKTIAASSGEDGLLLARKYKPQAIILDLDLPGMSGHDVLAAVKADPHLRHIPVHVISVDEKTLDPIKKGAVEYLTKPIAKSELDQAFERMEDFIDRKMKNLLIVEDDRGSRTAIRKLIGNGDVNCLEAASGGEALGTLTRSAVDCIVLDIGLPDMTGFDFIRKLEATSGRIPPVIVYTGKELSREENAELERYAESIIIKGVKSEERLLDETALFLHRTIEKLPDDQQKMISHLYDKEAIFNGKKILVVDDDMRNVFAISKVLKNRGMEVVKADNGLAALKALEKDGAVDLVLMDVMMPEMDGYEAMRRIRKQEKFRDLPVIALTAKAMKDDKQKCIDAGADDYTTKPVDIQRLLSLMQVWLSR